MDKKSRVWNGRRVAAFLIVAAIGASLHFIWKNIYAVPWAQFLAPLVPVNESYWEHTKLAVWPLLVYFIIQYFAQFQKQQPEGAWVTAAAAGLWSAVLTMFAVYASLIAAFGQTLELPAAILSFLFSIFVGMHVFFRAPQILDVKKYQWIAWTLLVILILSEIVYTYTPLPVALFKSTDYNYFGRYPPG